MEVSTKRLKNCDLVKASGRIDSSTAAQLAETFREINQADRFTIVFDMGGVDFISSAGLRVMVDVQKTCKRWGRGEMVLANVPRRVYNALDLTGFVPLFRFYDDVVDAVGSF